ncbi:MAG: hypothetical protein ABSF44_06685 [Candidatus Bathyarchaeia archaeon]|jgi:hypothetical protein
MTNGKTKVVVWKCGEHGETELMDTPDDSKAFCPQCGKQMTREGEYRE